MTTFTQLNVRLKNFLKGWLLVLGLKECLVECATLCVKSEVMLKYIYKQLVPNYIHRAEFLTSIGLDIKHEKNLGNDKHILPANCLPTDSLICNQSGKN